MTDDSRWSTINPYGEDRLFQIGGTNGCSTTHGIADAVSGRLNRELRERAVEAGFLVASLAVVAAGACGDVEEEAVTTIGTPSEGGSLVALDAECRDSLGDDGFGAVTIDERTIISNETGEITVPCRLTLTSEGDLTLNNVRLTTSHLVVQDGDAVATQRLRFDNSTLTGTPDSVFLLDLYDEDDTFSLHRSTLDYDASVWIRVVGNRDAEAGGGRLTVTNSTVRSLGERTQGVQLVAGASNGGRATFTSLTVETPGDVVLLAENCRATSLVGASPECGPLTSEEFTE